MLSCFCAKLLRVFHNSVIKSLLKHYGIITKLLLWLI